MIIDDIGVYSYLFQAAFPCFLSSIFLIFFIYFDNSQTKNTQRLFMLATISIICLSVSESFDYYFQQTHTHHEIRTILSAFSYTFRIASIGFTAAITRRTRSLHIQMIYLGIIINGIISFLSIPTGCIFSISENHQWSKGPLYFAPYLFVLWYGGLLLGSAFTNFSSNIKEALITLAGGLLCALGNVIELIWHWKLILSITFITFLCFYYLCLNIQLYRRDAMTALLNRRSFFMDAKRLKDRTFVVVSMDLNDLKLFNDREGHAAGDKALCAVGECMKTAFKHYGKGYRIGGDEFMAIFPVKSIRNAEPYINSFKNKLSKTRYRVACGAALYSPGDKIEDAMELADQEMYKNKREMKGKDGIIR